jgi:hypothetical protein
MFDHGIIFSRFHSKTHCSVFFCCSGKFAVSKQNGYCHCDRHRDNDYDSYRYCDRHRDNDYDSYRYCDHHHDNDRDLNVPVFQTFIYQLVNIHFVLSDIREVYIHTDISGSVHNDFEYMKHICSIHTVPSADTVICKIFETFQRIATASGTRLLLNPVGALFQLFCKLQYVYIQAHLQINTFDIFIYIPIYTYISFGKYIHIHIYMYIHIHIYHI